MDHLFVLMGCFVLPDDFAGGSIERDRNQRVVVHSRHKDAMAQDHRRRMAWRQSSLPHDIRFGAQLVGQLAIADRDSAGIDTTKLGPVAGLNVANGSEKT